MDVNKESYQTRIEQYESEFDTIYETETISSIKIINGITYVAVLKPFGSFSIYYELFNTCEDDINCIAKIGAKTFDKDIINQFPESKTLVYYGEYWL